MYLTQSFRELRPKKYLRAQGPVILETKRLNGSTPVFLIPIKSEFYTVICLDHNFTMLMYIQLLRATLKQLIFRLAKILTKPQNELNHSLFTYLLQFSSMDFINEMNTNTLYSPLNLSFHRAEAQEYLHRPIILITKDRKELFL